MLRPDHDWVRVYCDTTAEADALRQDYRFVAPILLRAFRAMVREKRGSVVLMEFVVNGQLKPTYLAVRWAGLEAAIDKCVSELELLEDFEECGALLAVKRAAREAEDAGTAPPASRAGHVKVLA